MPTSTKLRKLPFFSLTAAAIAFSQGTFAHTRLEIPSVTEGTFNSATHFQSNKVHNYEAIGHGCKDSNGGVTTSTLGTTVVFPNAISYQPIIGVDSGSGKVYATNQNASSYYAPLAGLGTLINTGVWPLGNVKTDALGNLDGFWAGGTIYNQNPPRYIDVEFYSNTVTIASASCARTVTFYLAIADVCDASVHSTIAADEQVLYWSPIPNFPGVPGQPFGAKVADPNRNIPVAHAYSQYDGYADAAHTIAGDGWGSPATLTVRRDLVNNPLPSNCTGNGGKGDDVHVYPAAAQINEELPAWSNPDQTGINYWK